MCVSGLQYKIYSEIPKLTLSLGKFQATADK